MVFGLVQMRIACPSSFSFFCFSGWFVEVGSHSTAQAALEFVPVFIGSTSLLLGYHYTCRLPHSAVLTSLLTDVQNMKKGKSEEFLFG